MKIDGSSTIDTILGSPTQFSLKHRVFNAVTFCGIIITGLILCSDVILNLGPEYYCFSSTVTIVFIFLYYWARKGNNFNKLVWLFVITEYSMISYDWYMLGGVTGASMFIALSFVVAIPIIMSGVQKYVVLSGVFLLCIGLFMTELTHPMLVHYYDNKTDHLTDVFVTAFFIGIGIIVAVSLVMRSHRNQHSQIQSLNGSLEIANKLMKDQNSELENALAEVKQLSGMLPICSFCKNIRDDKGYWKQIESYIRDHSEAEFSHGICPDCVTKHYPDLDIHKPDSC